MPETSADPPALPGVTHHYVTTGEGLTIHVAEAGPADGPAVMLVHGFPQHWWEWRKVIGPLAADGCRVLAPDLRGAGWSDAPRGPYRKADMAEDLLAVLDHFAVGSVTLAAHDWGGPAAFTLLLKRPERVSAFAGFNTIAPWFRIDGPRLRHMPNLHYQVPMALPGVGPRLLADPRHRYLLWLIRWVGGGYQWTAEDTEIFLGRITDPARAYAGSQWYRTFLAREFTSWVRGAYTDARPHQPLRWITGLRDPVITPVLHADYHRYAADLDFEHIPDAGHWIVDERPDLVVDRLRALITP